MYTIIGADQKEYGPISFDQVQQWIALGRADAATLARADGASDWKPLRVFPEFAASFSQSAEKPPVIGTIPPEQLTAEVLARDDRLDVGHCLSRAWQLLTTDFWPIIGVSALALVILGASGAAYVSLLVTGPVLGGLFCYYLKKIRGASAELADSFSGFTLAFLPLFLGHLVSTLLIGVGLIFCILPGIYLAVVWQMALPLIIDQRMEFWPALEVSRKVIHEKFSEFLWFAIAMTLINLLGVLILFVGIFVTFPLTMIALAYAYEDIFRAPASTPAQPK